jgi:hypothetical protein
MAAPASASTATPVVLEEDTPTGPAQRGRGVQGQYVYWVVQVYPKPETIARLGLKTPDDFDREAFRELIVKVHEECFSGLKVFETKSFREPHENGQPHNNLLMRCNKPHRWLGPGKKLLADHKVLVSYAPHIRDWNAGVTYGCVASEHKPPERLDHQYTEWAAPGRQITKKEDVLPGKFLKSGFVRHTKLTPMNFLDLCRENNLQSEDAVYAFAAEREGQGDKAVMAFCMEHDVSYYVGKANVARSAQERVRRAGMTREAILREHFEKKKCTCSTEGRCYNLMKDLLHMNGLDGPFQKAVMTSLREGRQKGVNLCLVGPPDCGKSYLFKPLLGMFDTYTRPDGGTYQLETLVGKELIFLNDMEYDKSARDWMPWSYFKRFVEGEEGIAVARPKNRGGNTTFDADSPVFLTAPKEIALYRGKVKDEYETDQMSARLEYMYLTFQIPKDSRQKDKPCSHCGCKLYLEGVPVGEALAAPAAPAAGPAIASSSLAKAAGSSVAAPQRRYTAVEAMSELTQLKRLKDDGVIDDNEFKRLKQSILEGH